MRRKSQEPKNNNNYNNPTRPPQNQSTLSYLLDQLSTFISYLTLSLFSSFYKIYIFANRVIFPHLKLLVFRYGTLITYLFILGNAVILPFAFLSFNFFHAGVVSETLDFSLSVAELRNEIQFVESVDEEGIVVTDVIDIKVGIDFNDDEDSSTVWGLVKGGLSIAGGDALDFDLDLNLNCFCNSAIDDYLVLNYQFSLDKIQPNHHSNITTNSIVSKSGILILNCKEPSKDTYLHLGDLFPYWLNILLFSQFWQDVRLWRLEQANNYKINLLRQFNLEQAAADISFHGSKVYATTFNQLQLTLSHTYNSLSLSSNPISHDHFQYLIDPRLTTLTLTRDLTMLKWFFKTFPWTSVILGTMWLSMSMNIFLWSVIIIVALLKEIDERDQTNMLFENYHVPRIVCMFLQVGKYNDTEGQRVKVEVKSEDQEEEGRDGFVRRNSSVTNSVRIKKEADL